MRVLQDSFFNECLSCHEKTDKLIDGLCIRCKTEQLNRDRQSI